MTSHKTYESHYSREANERDKKTKEFLRNVYPDRLYFPVEDVPPGVEYRWVREEIRGQKDTSNVTLMCKQGWTPVPFSRHPHFLADTSWFKSEDPTVIRIDGLILCERPIEYGEIEQEALRQQNVHALQAVNWTISHDERDSRVFLNETRSPQKKQSLREEVIRTSVKKVSRSRPKPKAIKSGRSSNVTLSEVSLEKPSQSKAETATTAPVFGSD
jgi:hypothetical protein